MDLIIGFIFGIGASVAAWVIVEKAIVPSIKFSNEIIRSKRHYQRMPRYRFYCINQGKRDVFDIFVFFRVSIKGLMEDTPNVSEIINITVGASNGHVVRIKAKGKIRLAINPHKCQRFSEPYFPDWIKTKHNNGTLSLDDVFSLGSKVEGKFIAYGYDKWSGARKYFESDIYTSKNIVDDNKDKDSFNPVAITVVEPPVEALLNYEGGEDEE